MNRIRIIRIALVALLAAILMGCGGDRVLVLDAWKVTLPGSPAEDVRLPAHFDRGLPEANSTYALDTKVDVPPEMRGKPLTLAIRHLPAISTLQVDGEEAVLLDASMLDRYRRVGPQRWRIPEHASKDGQLALSLTVEHRWAQSAWVLSPPELSSTLDGGSLLLSISAFNTTFAVGAVCASAFVVLLFGFLFVSLSGARRIAYGLFALGGATGMFYPAFALGLTQPFFGAYDAVVTAVMLTVAAISAIHFSHAYFNLEPPHRAWKLVPLLAFGTAIFAHNPFTASQYLGPIVVAVTALNASMQLWLLVRLRSPKPRPKNLYLIVLAWPATAVLGVPDFVAGLGAGDPLLGLRTASLGITLICLLQATALSREHLLSLRRADDLNAELAARVELLESKRREVEVLNDELKRQIAARSRELAESLVEGKELEGPVKALEPGDTIDDRYRIVRVIGAGGMGAVYEAERLADNKHFALKVLSLMTDGAARARFAREAQVAATVNHPNVVSIVDFDQASDGYLFLVMEFVEGNTLHDVRRRHLDVPWTLYVLAQVASALDAIHKKGIVHRDLKPGNVLLSRGADGRRPLVKITDFGISSLVDEKTSLARRAAPLSRPPSAPPPSGPPSANEEKTTAARRMPPSANPAPETPSPAPEAGATVTVHESDLERDAPSHTDSHAPTLMRVDSQPRTGDSVRPELTETGVVFGTPSYMAAELGAGTKSATRSADIFSLGVIAFELLTGRRPFRQSPLHARMEGHPLPVAQKFGEACPMLDKVVAFMLDRAIGHDPAARPSAHELAEALKAASELAHAKEA